MRCRMVMRKASDVSQGWGSSMVSRKVRLLWGFALIFSGMISIRGTLIAAPPKLLEDESREFRISVDGKNAGIYRMRISRYDDGTESVRGDSELTLNFVVFKYRMKSEGTEVWKDGHFVKLANQSDFNGDKYVVQASATDQDFTYVVNGSKHRTTSDIWVSSYWHEPQPEKAGTVMRLFDVDTGKELEGTLTKIGMETIAIGAQRKAAAHYSLRGDVKVDLWYDANHRLVRQEVIDSGHKSILQMESVKSSP